MDYLLQQPNQPLFPELIWSKPETKALAGKLLLIGGNIHAIGAPITAYKLAMDAGAGEVKVVMPAATRRYFAHTNLPTDIVFAPSTPSGSFGTKALNNMLEYADWADYACIVGDVSKNSESSVLLTELLTKMTTPIAVTGDAIDCLFHELKIILARPSTLLVPTFTQLQKIANQSAIAAPLKASLPLKAMAEWVGQFSATHKVLLLFTHNDISYAAHERKVIVTSAKHANRDQALGNAVNAAVWVMQHPSEPLKAITTSLCAQASQF